MFKKMRNKILLLLMIFISFIMTVAFAFIYLTTYNSVRLEAQNKLKALPPPPSQTPLSSPTGPEGLKEARMMIKEGKIEVDVNKGNTISIPPDYALSFHITVTSDGAIEKIDSIIRMPDEAYKEAASLAWKEQKDNSILSVGGKKWQYIISPISEIHVSMINGSRQESRKAERYIISFLDVTEMEKTMTNLLMTFLVAGLPLFSAIFFISLLFANRAIKPVAEAWEKQRQFIADASHELKTPLAIINSNSDALLFNQDETIGNQRKWIDYIKSEVSRMTTLVNNLLDLARTEDDSIKAEYSTFDISKCITEVILPMKPMLFEKGVTLTQDIEPGIVVPSDPEKVKQVVLILVDNAIKYTDENGKIDITLNRHKHLINFTISNSCKGISKQDLVRIFDRFYRVDESRARKSGGYGLGLSIAKAVADKLDARLTAQSVEGESVTFVFSVKG
ncbi:HAMP domain-containing histidine kinase [Paenibacillus sp. KQZ6P-2]|uniref:histidine kinase n=1 Tax=Paenibacillus mangrovi TaxID=2931978 RepID=A0A9X2B7S8_9BACL|nr:HAMP domain-containing sensor histidine kinase [Paenibacillus mangrovi]MCJ8015317.1 HAMP domain-containing histidine kinase [Paenibacillus mangrovi]